MLVGQREGGDPAGPDLILEVLARPPVDRRGSRLADPDVDARHLGVVLAMQEDEMARVVHHRDHDPHSLLPRRGLGRRRDRLGRLQGQDLLVDRLCRRRRHEDQGEARAADELCNRAHEYTSVPFDDGAVGRGSRDRREPEPLPAPSNRQHPEGAQLELQGGFHDAACSHGSRGFHAGGGGFRGRRPRRRVSGRRRRDDKPFAGKEVNGGTVSLEEGRKDDVDGLAGLQGAGFPGPALAGHRHEGQRVPAGPPEAQGRQGSTRRITLPAHIPDIAKVQM